ncbi:MAG TPA: trypsin-like peptidase domain-containing protein [Burkholderiaceae bacterium]|nr:trypsin-like peptidase domain-containing protein [Burkholderiaceae bacterium]
MRRPALYSSSSRSINDSDSAQPLQGPVNSNGQHQTLRGRFRAMFRFARHDTRALWTVIGLLSLLLLATLWLALLRPGARQLTQADIDAAVLKTLESNVLPSPAAKAYEAILPSLVRVTSYVKNKDGDEDVEQAVGTGVVIIDKGIILTNLHVIQGAETIKVVFSDGLESTASVKGTQESDDLAVLQAHKIPDDLHAATMRSTADLVPGDQVVAVGFPFGIGPSVSSGVVSGLKRVFRSPQTNQEISNLIQFDAAANPGNSGGPLVTMDGQVVGIVTAILNPGRQRTFIGIGFAVPIENAASAVGLHPF